MNARARGSDQISANPSRRLTGSGSAIAATRRSMPQAATIVSSTAPPQTIAVTRISTAWP